MSDQSDLYDRVGAYADTFFTFLSILLLIVVELYERKCRKDRN